MRTHMFVSILVTAPFAAFHALADRPPGELARCASAVAEDAGLSGSVTISLSGTPLVDLYRGRQAGPGSKLIDSQTRFNIGSVSKMFTSVAVGQLVDRGKLRLDEPIGDIVGGLSSATSRVTVRQLLNHTAGTGDFFRPENMETMRRARTAADILPLIVHENPAFKPGTRFLYSNSGFALLGVAIERVAGMRYGEYLKRYVFDPAGMTSTGLDPHPLATLAVAMTKVELQEGDFSGAVHRRTVSGGPGTPGGMAPPATPGGRLLLIGHDNGPSPALSMRSGELRQAPGATEGYGSPAGGLYSTGADLARFASALASGKLLSKSTLVLFTSPQVEAAAAIAGHPARFYGFGFGLIDEGATHWAGHNGGTLGANAEFFFEPQGGWSVSVLSNRDPPAATNLMHQIRQHLVAAGKAGTCPSDPATGGFTIKNPGSF